MFVPVKTLAEVRRLYPGYEVYKKVAGGYMCFTSTGEYETWKNQK